MTCTIIETYDWPIDEETLTYPDDICDPGGALASLVVWVEESQRRRYAPSWPELLYRSGLAREGDWDVWEFRGLVLEAAAAGVIRLRQLPDGGVVLRRAV